MTRVLLREAARFTLKINLIGHSVAKNRQDGRSSMLSLSEMGQSDSISSEKLQIAKFQDNRKDKHSE